MNRLRGRPGQFIVCLCAVAEVEGEGVGIDVGTNELMLIRGPNSANCGHLGNEGDGRDRERWITGVV